MVLCRYDRDESISDLDAVTDGYCLPQLESVSGREFYTTVESACHSLQRGWLFLARTAEIPAVWRELKAVAFLVIGLVAVVFTLNRSCYPTKSAPSVSVLIVVVFIV